MSGTVLPRSAALSALRGLQPAQLEIAGFEPFSAVDWPGKLSAVVFLQGCPWRCGFCHNVDIIDSKKKGTVAWQTVLDTLHKRTGLLDGVIFSGGEPTRQLAVVEAAAAVKAMGFQVGLHTGGAYPKRIEQLIPYLDWVGFDIKATPQKYEAVTAAPGDGSIPLKSLKMLLDAGIDVQVRTTLDPLVLDEEDIVAIREQVAQLGVTDYVVQRVRTEGTRPEYAAALEAYRAKCAHGSQDVLPLS